MYWCFQNISLVILFYQIQIKVKAYTLAVRHSQMLLQWAIKYKS